MQPGAYYYKTKWCPNTETSKKGPTGDVRKVQERIRQYGGTRYNFQI